MNVEITFIVSHSYSKKCKIPRGGSLLSQQPFILQIASLNFETKEVCQQNKYWSLEITFLYARGESFWEGGERREKISKNTNWDQSRSRFTIIYSNWPWLLRISTNSEIRTKKNNNKQTDKNMLQSANLVLFTNSFLRTPHSYIPAISTEKQGKKEQLKLCCPSRFFQIEINF